MFSPRRSPAHAPFVLALLSISGPAAAQATEPKTNAPPVEPGTTPLDPDKVEPEKAFYLSGDLAFTRADLGLLVDETDFDKTGANGVLYGLSAGVRHKAFRLGLRWRNYDTTEFTLWTIGVSAGYALAMRPLTPIFSAHLGYVFDQKMQQGLIRSSLPSGTIDAPDPDVKGVLFGVDVFASYWVTNWFRLGPFAGADLMFVSREQARLPRSVFGPSDEAARNPLFSDSGFGLGLNVLAGLRAAFDIGYQ